MRIWHRVIRLLISHLKPSKAMRVVAALRLGHGDYMREREEMFGDQSVAELAKQVRRYERRKQKK